MGFFFLFLAELPYLNGFFWVTKACTRRNKKKVVWLVKGRIHRYGDKIYKESGLYRGNCDSIQAEA